MSNMPHSAAPLPCAGQNTTLHSLADSHSLRLVLPDFLIKTLEMGGSAILGLCDNLLIFIFCQFP